eukprot:evm.model.NODE_5358_length_8697_cov_30.312637.2
MGLVGEEAEKVMKPFKDKVDDAVLDELISKLDEQTATIATENENTMYNTTWAYEEKNQDEVPDPLNGFKILERREEGVLKDPAFLQYHVWMGLEQERLDLLLSHLRFQHEKKGAGGRQGGHPAVSLYELKELGEATEQYGRKKKRSSGLPSKKGRAGLLPPSISPPPPPPPPPPLMASQTRSVPWNSSTSKTWPVSSPS